MEKEQTTYIEPARPKGEYEFLGRRISGPFTIPAGVVTTDIHTILRIAREVPEVGVITTKSIGLQERAGNREPILTQYAPGCFMNAVGLTNIGAEAFAEQLRVAEIPANKFLLTSIFGWDTEEIVKVALTLAPYSNGLEINLSCPHTEGLGMALGQDPRLVSEVVSAAKRAVDIPVIAKLTSNVTSLTEIAEAAIEGGADGLCFVNTVGPGFYMVDGYPVLSNEVGGMSGQGILPIALKCLREIRSKFQIPTIVCGGIRSADDVRSCRSLGADIVGIGTALAGLSTPETQHYFSQLGRDIKDGTNKAVDLLRTVEMGFTKFQLVENQRLAPDLSLLVFDRSYQISPGQFVFAWIPGIGEKPFSVLDDDPLTLAVQKRGCFTEKLVGLDQGTEVYFRGPYGNPVEIDKGKRAVLVGGGCGMAALYLIAKESWDTEIFFGARDRQHLFYLEQMRKYAEVHVATDTGDFGHHGLVTDLLAERLSSFGDSEVAFYNCGPIKMIDKAVEIESGVVSGRDINSSREEKTKCGVGLCGSCATGDGSRMCVDGPFMSSDQLGKQI